MIKYEHKECECGNKDRNKFEWHGCGGYKNGDYYDAYYCNVCRKDVEVRHKAKEEESEYIGTHDGGWDDM
ncbi:hypothetical protein DVV91_10035 [Clostridium botulinum]|uniref:hypothetical protein n=1 Tax=Clostridium botulinum TaxID=1491 RepID=UPI00196743B2|nr:hypothetical protein [Clostridium botulinum]MBN1074680.1 hypothetical protein [Clostridium botulinum]